MGQLEAIRLFVRVVDRGSFSRVAREVGIGQPAVSKQIAALEATLGAQLLRRTSHSLSLTEAGHAFYESALRVVGDLDVAVSSVGRGQAAPSGLVRVTVAPAFGRMLIVPRLGELFARYPDLAVELDVTERVVDLVHEGLDVAIRHGALADSTLVARALATTPVVTVATPGYLAAAGEPRRPRDLEAHACIVFADGGAPQPWRFTHRTHGELVHAPRGRFRTDDAEQLRAAVLAGYGIGHAPGWLFARDLASGAVRRLLRTYERPALPISAVYVAGRPVPTKITVFLEFLAACFATEPLLDQPRR